MSDVAIRAVDLRKVYRLYKKPSYRFRDMFGLLGDKPGTFTEHAALDGVNLEILRGEKVAIIGRNGAGKSTFLKLVTSVIQPTSGVLEVKAHVHALLQIGTGFHPEFTGRENVYAYFAQLGIRGRDADQRCIDVVEFAELEEYIDQPVKTYSTGMAVRLMFSTSTAIAPDLLVLDEVLGVGDAYFAHKSYERIRQMCDRDGTSLLLVTHDIYSAAQICARLVWIDRGRVLMDAAAPTVIRAYEDSIRQQEESRLRVRKQARLRGAASQAGRPLLFEIFAVQNGPQPCPVYFSRIELMADGRSIGSLPLGAQAFDESLPSHLQREGTCWGEAVDWRGRTARPFLNYGSPFHKVTGVFDLPAALDPAGVSVLVEYWTDRPCRLAARWFADAGEQALGNLPAAEPGWTTQVVAPLADGTPTASSDNISLSGRQGSGAIAVSDVRCVDSAGVERHQFKHGERFDLLIAYAIHQPDFRQRVQVQVAFHKDGVQITCRVLGRGLALDTEASGGVLRMTLAALPLAVGDYSITVMVVEVEFA